MPKAKSIKDMRGRDQFFTKSTISKQCMTTVKKKIHIMKDSFKKLTIVEPAAGNGDFYYNFPKSIRLAFDIEKPKHIVDHTYIEADFLKISWLPTDTVYVGNPPFGKSGKLAFDFILKCIDLKAAMIAFILPPNINTKARLDLINKSGYTLVHYEQLPDNSFYFFNNKEIIDAVAESVFQIYVKTEIAELYNMKVIGSPRLKNSSFAQVHTINGNVIKNPKRDVNGVEFMQNGIGKKWIGKCDFYLPLRVFNKNSINVYDTFKDPGMSNIGYGIICTDKDIKNKIVIENCYNLGTNKIKTAKKQLILKEIIRIQNLEKGD